VPFFESYPMAWRELEIGGDDELGAVVVCSFAFFVSAFFAAADLASKGTGIFYFQKSASIDQRMTMNLYCVCYVLERIRFELAVPALERPPGQSFSFSLSLPPW